MAYFKISLLTNQFENNKSILLQDVISEFNTQLDVYNSKQFDNNNYSLESRKYSYCYSYNEKFSLTQNAQKTLSFDMDKFIIKDNLREENPFARNIIIGSQILLVDQYNNNYFFTVKSIDYDIKEINITYKITCQDTFSYQATRQRSGYTIDNDPSESDFIGAQTIDWWVINKISPECHLSYSYLKMSEGLYEEKTTDGYKYKTFKYGDILSNVNRIIKDAYSLDKDKDLFETIPFSCSGSNANAALIALGEYLDLQIKTFEHIDGLKYFWFEPKKNTNRIGGLIYSPYNSIQSFGLSHKGDSLTTIMNVEGPTHDDEIITLIPAITPHFSNFFLETSWERQNYQKGMFLEQCQPQRYYLNNNNEYTSIQDEQRLFYVIDATQVAYENTWENHIFYKDKFLYIQLFKDIDCTQEFEPNPYFTSPIFGTDNLSKINLTLTSSGLRTESNYNSNTNLWSFVFHKNVNEQDIEEVFSEGDNYKDYLNSGYTDYWIRIFIGSIDSGTSIEINSFEPNLSFSREVSQEDIEFAQAAEECPWLENKLIDFTYFLESKMITPDEYRDLMNWLTNELRVVNGRLMFYSKAYYTALHERTKLLADLTNSLDALGAAASSDIIVRLRSTGNIGEESDITSFNNAYNSLLLPVIEEKEKLLNYDDILSDYFNKYFSAEQRFLKNIKKFKDYFNDKPSSWLDDSTAFYKYRLEITQNASGHNYIFNNTTDTGELISILDIPYCEEDGTTCYNIYKTEKLPTDNDDYKVLYKENPVNKNNYQKYFVRNTDVDVSGRGDVRDGERYNSNWTYFQSDNAPIASDDIESAIVTQNNLKVRNKNGKLVGFHTVDSTIASIVKFFRKRPMLNSLIIPSKYSSTFPATEIYETSDASNPVYSFVNTSNYKDFLKCWYYYSAIWSDIGGQSYDVFGNYLGKVYNGYVDINSIYCSKQRPIDSFFKSSDDPSINFGVTFKYAKEHQYYFKETNFYRAVGADEYLLKGHTYKIFELKYYCDRSEISNLFSSNEFKGTKQYHLIYNELQDIDLIGTHSKEAAEQTVATFLNNIYGVSMNGIICTTSILCPVWNDFIIVELTDYNLKNGSEVSYSTSNTYCTANNMVVNFDDYEFPSGFSSPYHLDDPYIAPEGDFNPATEYYMEQGEDYIRVLTIEQMIAAEQIREPNDPSYRYINPYIIKLDYLTPFETKIVVSLMDNQIIRNDNNDIIGFNKGVPLEYKIYFTTDDEHATPLQYKKAIDDSDLDADLLWPYIQNDSVYQTKDFSIGSDIISLKLTKTYINSLNVINNGNLWWLCRPGNTLADLPNAVSIAASIEAQLQEYWQQAYTAGLYSRYFLPESWQPNYSKDINMFANDIIGSNEDGSIYLKDIYIPNVSIYTKDGKTVLPKYVLSRKTEVIDTDPNKLQEDISINAADFKNNPILLEAIEFLGDSDDNYVSSEAGTTTYYYIANKDIDTGCTWSRLMINKVGNEFSDYSGLYVLSYRLIMKNYEPLVLYEYNALKKQQQYIWNTLYQTYGYLMLENNYKDETATNSPELMILAKYAFKDYTAPERQYNITVIDSTSLKGYKGEEVRVGDGIQIDAQAYYNEYDQIFKSLSQYLFVTDISYTLRSPTDISLTVNTIKYQDKLIQRLVKLIK